MTALVTEQLALSQVGRDDEAVAQDDQQQWATWLKNALAGRPQKYIVERSRGEISEGLVSRWMRGQIRSPRPEWVLLVADILGRDRNEALAAAGHQSLIGTAPSAAPPPDPDIERLVQHLKSLGLPDRKIADILEVRRVRLQQLDEELRRVAEITHTPEQGQQH